MNKKEIKIIIDPETITNTYNINTHNKLINKSFPITTTNKIRPKNYELFNVVSENGDSIYSLPFEELPTVEERGGQVYISLSEIRKIVNEELDKKKKKKKRFRSSDNKTEYD